MIAPLRSAFLLVLATPATVAADKPNVLFIAVDDLRPQMACYGKEFMHTPNLDRLAARGVLFESAYCMVPTCGASRASLFTSIRPAPKRFITHLAIAEKDAPGILPLHTHFKQNGYTTISLGKILHNPSDHKNGWSEAPWRPTVSGYYDQEAEKRDIAEDKKLWPKKSKHRGMAWEAADVADDAYPDGVTAKHAMDYLERFSKSPDHPFFLAVGFFKPHLPFNAPQKYWDLYDFDQIDIPDNYHAPKDAPDGAVHASGELRAYSGIPATGPVDRETARKLIHGYYACVSYTDAQIGKLLDSLDRLGLADNTIIVLWGDHGWQLGEHGMWNKHSCFETSMHAPLMVAAPMMKAVNPGSRVPALTEFIDIYPSLCELTGLDTPTHCQGTSFVAQLKDPSTPGKPYAVGRFMAGDTIRSDTQRYSEYREKGGAGDLTGHMLYDHTADPNENTNIAAQQASEVEKLAKELTERKGK